MQLAFKSIRTQINHRFFHKRKQFIEIKRNTFVILIYVCVICVCFFFFFFVFHISVFNELMLFFSETIMYFICES